jgi:hypothetical protein
MRVFAVRSRPFWLLILWLAVTAGCEGAKPEQVSAALTPIPSGARAHPDRGNLPDRGTLAAFIRIGDSLAVPGKLREFAAALRGARPVTSVGSLDGDESQLFGYVEDVAVDEAGRFFVLDSRYNNVRIFDQLGRSLGAFSGPGRGPGELMAPEAIEQDQLGRLVVADRFNILKVFERRGATFQVAASIPVRLVPEDFCLMGDRVVVQGVRRGGGTVHAFSMMGDSVLSFGAPYRSQNWLVQNQLSDGPIACSPEAGTVVTMYKYLPIIYGYAPDGQLRWMSQLADFRPIGIVEDVEDDGAPVVAFTPRPDGHDLVASLMATGSYVLVQTGRHTPASLKEQQEYAELRTYLLSAATGEGVYVGNHLPRLTAIADDRAYAAVNDPFPQVRVLELGAARRVP